MTNASNETAAAWAGIDVAKGTFEVAVHPAWIPGKPVQREGPAPSTHRPDLAHNVMPDLIAAHLERILGRLDDVEAAIRANGNGPDSHYSKAPNLRAPDPDYVI